MWSIVLRLGSIVELNCVQSRVCGPFIPLSVTSLSANEEEALTVLVLVLALVLLVVNEVVTQRACGVVTCSEVPLEAEAAGEGKDEVAGKVASGSCL